MPELMKGHKWRDHKHKMTYPAWVEVKHDEIRVHVLVTPQGTDWHVQFLSYAGKPLFNLDKFAPLFRELAETTGYHEFDLGFEANLNFNDSYRWVRSKRGIPADLTDVPTRFFLFDLPTVEGMPFESRVNELHRVWCTARALDIPMHRPAGTWALTPEDVDTVYTRVRDEGHEGVMVKSMQHEYVRGSRSYGWLKVKPEDDADGVIVELIEAISETGQPLGRAGSVRIRMEDGSEATPHGIPHDLGRDMYQNPGKYIGHWAEFNFMERDRQGGYRHPTWHRLREAKA